MVKELDDAPRDDLAIVLDQDPDGVAGPVGQSSFDAAVRAAGALALAHVLWNRRVVLVGTAPETEDVRIRAAGHDWELALDALATVEPVEGARVDRALRSPSAAITRAREIVVVTGRPGPGRRAAARAPPRRPLRLARDHGLRDLSPAGRAIHSSRPRCARRRRACWWPSSPPRSRSPRLSPGAARERPVASVVGGFGRRLLAASVPVAAVAYAWASLESGPSVRVFAGVAALAVPAALPARLAVRVAVAVVTLGGLTLVAAGRQRRGGPGRRRPGPAGHLRRRAAVRPEDPSRAACARDPHRLRVLPRDRGHRRQQAVPRRSGRRRRDRLARHDPAGPEHDRDGSARRCSPRSGRS